MPISSITWWTKPSALPERTPAERAIRRPGKNLRASAAAMGERTEFIEQTNSTVGRFDLALVDAAGIGLHGADQGEQPAGGVEIHLELVVEPGAQQLGRLVVEAAAGHVDGFDLVGRGGLDGVVIAVADAEIVADQAAERGQRQIVRGDRLVGVGVAHVEHDVIADDRDVQRIGPLRLDPGRVELVVLDQIVDGDAPLMHLVGIDRGDGIGVERDGDDPVGLLVEDVRRQCHARSSMSPVEPDRDRAAVGGEALGFGEGDGGTRRARPARMDRSPAARCAS